MSVGSVIRFVHPGVDLDLPRGRECWGMGSWRVREGNWYLEGGGASQYAAWEKRQGGVSSRVGSGALMASAII